MQNPPALEDYPDALLSERCPFIEAMKLFPIQEQF